MRSEIENANLVASKRDGLLQQLKQIEDQVEELSPEELSDKLKALSKAVGTEKKRSELSEKFPGFSSKIPSFGGDDAQTQDIAGKISQAIQSGNWQPVLSKLNPNAEGVNKGWLYYSVVQIVGTLYYSLAKQDEKQMELLLDLFPIEVRQAMANCMTGYETDNKWSSRETDKQTYNIYGSGQQVKDRLNESIAKDDIQFEIASNSES